MNIPIIIIAGPTGVGKSELAERLGTLLPIEIINMDMGQLYLPLTIGTAKPRWRESAIPHHMFDSIDVPVNYTVMEYNARVVPLIDEVKARGSIPVLVGGSGFYLKSLLFPPIPQGQVVVQEQAIHEGTWDELHAIDPERAAHIHPHDIYRIARALHIWHTTGKKPSTCAPILNPPSDFMLIFLTRDRNELYQRINKRVAQMIEDGWEAECVPLYGTPWESFIREKNIIGYPEIMDVIAGKVTIDDVLPGIAQKTRQYAKRQEIFWRMLHKKIANQKTDKKYRIEEVNLTLLDLDLYINQLLDRIQSFYL